MFLDTNWQTKELLESHSMDMRQFIGFRQSTLQNGMRIVEAYNTSGLNFTILPDRGLDIWSAHYKGAPLTWLAQGSPFPADFGGKWLELFSGGLLTTCGLTHFGPPEVDSVTGEQRDLHGKYTRLRANEINSAGVWEDDNYVAVLSGVVSQHTLFGTQLRFKRTYRMELGAPAIGIVDEVTNIGDLPSPLMVLYHFNVGYPLVREGVELVTTGDAYPRDEEARKGWDNWQHYSGPISQYAEQVYFHHVKAFDDGISMVALVGEDFGIEVQWQTKELPYLTQWKNTREGIYVCGIEPANGLPIGQNAMREKGILETIEPGETRTFHNVLSIIEGADAVSQRREAIKELEADGTQVESIDLSEYK